MTDSRITNPNPETQTPLVIRLLEPHEHEAVGRLTYDAYAHDYEISPEYGHQLLHPEERLMEYEIWVAVDGDSSALLGTISILRPGFDLDGRLGAHELYFRLLGVSPNARRRGVGARLTEFSADLARERGFTAVTLNSGENMLGAHALYRSLGFVRDLARDVRLGVGDREFTVYTFSRSVP